MTQTTSFLWFLYKDIMKEASQKLKKYYNHWEITTKKQSSIDIIYKGE